MANLPTLDYQTKFGRVQQDNAGVITFTGNAPTIQDWILRHTSLQKTLYNLQILRLALGNPVERNRYITWKREHLMKIGTNSTTLFRMEFERFMSAGSPEHVARKRARVAADAYKKSMIEQHDKQFPDEFTYEQALRLLKVDKPEKKNRKDF
jgi:hypothetical protein